LILCFQLCVVASSK